MPCTQLEPMTAFGASDDGHGTTGTNFDSIDATRRKKTGPARAQRCGHVRDAHALLGRRWAPGEAHAGTGTTSVVACHRSGIDPARTRLFDEEAIVLAHDLGRNAPYRQLALEPR